MAANKEIEDDVKEGRSRKSLILVIALSLLVLGGGGAGAYIFFLSGGEDEDNSEVSASADSQEPSNEIVEPERGETLYHELANSFTVNITESSKMMQVKLALRTPYGQEMLTSIVAHEIGMRAPLLEELSKISEETISSLDFRRTVSEQLRQVVNSVLEEQNIYGGIDSVLFTEFLVQ